MADQSEKQKKNSVVRKNGGARPGAGRKKGGENEDTRKRRIAEKEYKERVVAHIHDLFNSQLNLAKGLTYMFRVDETEDDKGKKIRKHVRVEIPSEMIAVLDELDGDESGRVDDPAGEEKYYYLTTKDPDNRAIDSMMDRVFGKAPQTIEHSGGIDVNKLSEYKSLTNEQLLELAAAGIDERTEESEGGTSNTGTS